MKMGDYTPPPPYSHPLPYCPLRGSAFVAYLIFLPRGFILILALPLLRGFALSVFPPVLFAYLKLLAF